MSAATGKRVDCRPNVVLVITDDQGYGDLGCTGNPWIQTPNIDGFYNEATRFTDFHVSPLCTPTRGALMTGHNPLRNGAWATCWGRSILRRDEVTMADIFLNNGYRTGMFGKWHLGDNYPYRPQDRGFETVVAHKGGGVGQTPDFWGNDYFDDTYFANGTPRCYEGYCTDVWFDQALRFIETSKDEPFFCYLATNAPHSPYLVAERYKRLYEDNDSIPEPAFYGMITNIDENMGRLVKRLKELGLEENTILIFMTDNGSSGGWRPAQGKGYNAGMRGMKGSYYDGGHRVPFFIRWPGGGIGAGRDIDDLATHMDLLPTFIDLCRLKAPADLTFDGMSLAPLLRGECEQLPVSRTVFVQYRQDTNPPEKWENAVMTRRWRLIRGRELYDIKADPGQKHDVAAQHPDVVQTLRAAHEQWWEEVSERLDEYCPISVGNENENPTCLSAMDVLGDVAWNQPHIREAKKSSGIWMVDVETAGQYQISLRRWPEELGLPVDAADETRSLVLADTESVAIHPTRARLRINDIDETASISEGAESATFNVNLEAGIAKLEAWFITGDGDAQGAYYVYVEKRD